MALTSGSHLTVYKNKVEPSSTIILLLTVQLILSVDEYRCSDPPPDIENGVWTGTNSSGNYICLPGYVLTDGDLIINCTSGLEWFGKPPVCQIGEWTN